MNRGKRFLLYISSVVFCLLFVIFTNNKVSALDESAYTFSCIDRENGTCSASSFDMYYVLEKIEIDDSSIENLVIPNTYIGEFGEANVAGIASNVIESDTKLNLNSLTLPKNLEYISDNAFYNIISLKEFNIPSGVKLIGKNIFEENASVENIYLNNYIFGMQEYLEIDVLAFDKVNISKIICANHDIYNYFLSDEESTLKKAPLVTVVTYKYYQYENEKLTDLNSTKTYYVGKNQLMTDIPGSITLDGLNFVGWYLKVGDSYTQIKLNDPIYFNLYTNEYNIYPRFELKDLSFVIDSSDASGKNVNQAQYNGSNNLIKLSVSKLKHEVLESSDFDYGIKWSRVISGKDELVSETDFIYLTEVEQSGTYKGTIYYMYSYMGTDYTNSVDVTKTIKINKAPLYVMVNDASKVYGEYLSDSDISHSVKGLLNGDIVNSVTYEYLNSGDINAGTYLNAIKVLVSSIVGNGKERIANYNIIYSYGDYTVTRRPLIVYYDEDLTFEYGNDIRITKVYSDKKVYGVYENSITVEFTKTSGNTVGEYSINGVSSISNNNYIADYKKDLTTGVITVIPKKVETHVVANNDTYDGNKKILSVYYKDVHGINVYLNYVVKYDGEIVYDVIDAGEYEVVIDSIKDKNYDFLTSAYKSLKLTIYKATEVLLYKDYQSFVYSGERIVPLVSINNKEQTPEYVCMLGNLLGDYCVNSGSYNAKVIYEETKNYNRVETDSIVINITKYNININPKSFTVYYGDRIQLSEELIINGEKVIAKYDTNASVGSPVGSYNITKVTLQNTSNYGDHRNYDGYIDTQECVGKVKILKRPIEIVYYNYSDLTYDGKVKNIGVYALDSITKKVITDIKFTPVCDEVEFKEIRNAGKYHVRAYFNSDKYEAINTNLLVFEIGKAYYDLNGLSFNDKSYTLNFKNHELNISGILPEGVKVNYTIDGEEGNSASSPFSHKVVAKFEIDAINYHPIDDMEATLYIDMAWVFITFTVLVVLAAIAVCSIMLYIRYRRIHPKKIKLKIKNVIKEDLAAKRVATSVKEVLGDEEVKHENLEDENDLVEDISSSRSFIDRIYAADSDLKYYYSEVKNELLSYAGISHTVDRKYEVFYHGTRQVAKLSICNGVLRLYVNLDPDKYDKSQYNHRDMSKFECHAKTPLRIDVNTTETLRHAKVFIRIIRKKENLKAVSSFVKVDYEKFYTLKENVFPRLFKKMFTGTKKGKKQ